MPSKETVTLDVSRLETVYPDYQTLATTANGHICLLQSDGTGIYFGATDDDDIYWSPSPAAAINITIYVYYYDNGLTLNLGYSANGTTETVSSTWQGEAPSGSNKWKVAYQNVAAYFNAGIYTGGDDDETSADFRLYTAAATNMYIAGVAAVSMDNNAAIEWPMWSWQQQAVKYTQTYVQSGEVVGLFKVKGPNGAIALGNPPPTASNAGTGIWMDRTGIYGLNAGSQTFILNASNGQITSTAGTIGGWTINSTYLAKDTGTDATSAGMAPADLPFYAGATYADRATAPFRVQPSGLIYATGVITTGGAIADYGLGLPTLMLCHYDGAMPYTTDYTGSVNGDRGQVGTYGGGVIFRPGKFGKAVQIGEATTNMVLNPSAETTGNFGAIGTATATADATYSLYGSQAYKVITAAANDGIFLTLSALTNAINYATVYTRGAFPTMQLSLDGGVTKNSPTLLGNDGTWYLYGFQFPALQANASTSLRITQSDSTARTFYVDGIQVEQKSYETPYCDGSLGLGHSWSGTANASTSSRTAANLSYATSSNINVLGPATIGVWFNCGTSSNDGNRMIFRANGATGQIMMYIAGAGNSLNGRWGTNTSGGSVVTSHAWHLGTIVFDGSNISLYLDGVLVGGPTAVGTAVGAVSSIYTGSNTASTQYLNGMVDEFFSVGTAMTAEEIYGIFLSSLPVVNATNPGEFRLTTGGQGYVFGNANGIFGVDSNGHANWGLTTAALNANLWGANQSETLANGAVMMGSNEAGFANLLWDPTAKQLKFRSATAIASWIGTDGSFNINAGHAGVNAVNWYSGANQLAQVYGDAADATHGTLFLTPSSGISGAPTINMNALTSVGALSGNWTAEMLALTPSGGNTPSNGANNNFGLAGNSFLYVTGPTGAFGFTGFNSTGIQDGCMLYVYNSTTQDMTIYNSNAGSSSANQIFTLTGVNVVLNGATHCVAIFMYSGTAAKWILTGVRSGQTGVHAALGSLTAAAGYGANEQTMLQQAHDSVRTLMVALRNQGEIV